MSHFWRDNVCQDKIHKDLYALKHFSEALAFVFKFRQAGEEKPTENSSASVLQKIACQRCRCEFVFGRVT